MVVYGGERWLVAGWIVGLRCMYTNVCMMGNGFVVKSVTHLQCNDALVCMYRIIDI